MSRSFLLIHWMITAFYKISNSVFVYWCVSEVMLNLPSATVTLIDSYTLYFNEKKLVSIWKVSRFISNTPALLIREFNSSWKASNLSWKVHNSIWKVSNLAWRRVHFVWKASLNRKDHLSNSDWFQIRSNSLPWRARSTGTTTPRSTSCHQGCSAWMSTELSPL